MLALEGQFTLGQKLLKPAGAGMGINLSQEMGEREEAWTRRRHQGMQIGIPTGWQAWQGLAPSNPPSICWGAWMDTLGLSFPESGVAGVGLMTPPTGTRICVNLRRKPFYREASSAS